MKRLIFLFTLFHHLTITHAYLNVDSISYPYNVDQAMREKFDGIQMRFELGRVFEEMTVEKFGNFSGRLLKWDNEYFQVNGGEYWEGSVVIVPTDYTYPELDSIMLLKARAFVIGTSIRGSGQLSLFKGVTARVNNWDILSFQISQIQSENVVLLWEFLDIGGSINVTIDDQNNFNGWTAFADSTTLLVMQIVLCVYSFIVMIICIYKFHYAVQNHPDIMIWHSLPKTVLLAELIVAIFRVVYFSIDPICLRRLTTVELSYYLAQASAPISISTTIGVLIHWNKITSYSVKTFKKLRVVIIIFIISMLLFGIVILGVLPIFIDAIFTTFMGSIFYTFTSVVLAVYTFITLPNILKVLQKHPNKQVLIEKTILIGISGFLTVLWLAPPGVFVFPSTGTGPLWTTVWFIWFYLLVSISLTQILVFSSGKTKRKNVVHLSKTGHSKQTVSK